ncbi:MAG: SDR family NAD(P)-dependent oxidoreductase, partial [Microbacteriaceae bacterium]|nr:SDR family NAD(P)-dependent oxidoreductase [Microbacteriaceae bacterium]
MRVLLTGGAGSIGSHTALVLIQHGHEVLVLDDFSNSSPESVHRIEELTGQSIPVVEADLVDGDATRDALAGHTFDAVIHFAGLKAVGESVEQPTRYYRTNLVSTLNLLELMQERGVTKLVFSSSATVYGDPQYVPQDEQHPVGVGLTNPYGWSKAMNEQIIR